MSSLLEESSFLGGSDFATDVPAETDVPWHDASNEKQQQATGRNISQFQEESPQGEAEYHGNACFFHIAFKLAAVVSYLFCTILTDNFILAFIVCVLCLAADFWTTKNISGRLLVGLRWWNHMSDDGTSEWVFETKKPNRKIHTRDSLVFWTGLYIFPVVWLLLAFSALTSPKWLLIVLTALILQGSNVVGYWKCQKDAKQKLQMFIASRF